MQSVNVCWEARRECLDHMLIVSEAHLRRILSEYVNYFNRSRPHQGINERTPKAADTFGLSSVSTNGSLVALRVWVVSITSIEK
jgi:hypothetical protein